MCYFNALFNEKNYNTKAPMNGALRKYINHCCVNLQQKNLSFKKSDTILFCAIDTTLNITTFIAQSFNIGIKMLFEGIVAPVI
jgi:hypothetical protein